MTRIKGLKQGLAGVLALGTAAAVPLVVVGSQAQQGLAPWLPGGAGGGSAGDAEPAAAAADGSAAAPPDWSLSRVLEEVLEQVRQLAVGGSGADEEAGGDEEAEEGWEEEYELPAADHASSPGPEAAAAATPLHAQQQQAQQHSGRQRRHGRDFLSARRVAAEHPEDARQLRQMTLAELARLRAEDGGSSSSSSSSSTDGGKQAQRRGRHRQVQAPPAQQQAGQEAHQQQRQEQQEQQGQLPARFTDAELVRFAIMQGLLQASSPAEREAKLREGAAAAARTALWLERHPFSSDEELTRFAHLVHWEGPDAAGRPVLRILIGAAVTECRGNAALAFANAILTHMEQGVSSRLYDAPPQPEGDSSSGSSSAAPPLQFVISQPAESHGLGQRGIPSSGGSSDGSSSGNCSGSVDGGGGGAATAPGDLAAALGPAAAAAPPLAASPPMPSPSPEQVVVLMDCRGASTLNAARISWVFKAVASSLSHHYPGRLHELVLLDLPVVLGWMVKGVKQLVHPETRNKFRVVHAGQAQQAQQAQQVQAQQQGPASGGTPGAAAAQVAAASTVAAPAVQPRWPLRRRGQQPQHAQQLQEPQQQPAQQAGQASAVGLQDGAQQGEGAGQQEADMPRSEGAAAPKRPHKRRMQGASKRKQAEEEQGQEQPGRQTEPVQQPPAAEQQPAPEPAATQPAWQRRQRGRLAEQQDGIEAGQQEAAAAAGKSRK